jgi:hypothetical protein
LPKLPGLSPAWAIIALANRFYRLFPKAVILALGLEQLGYILNERIEYQ